MKPKIPRLGVCECSYRNNMNNKMNEKTISKPKKKKKKVKLDPKKAFNFKKTKKVNSKLVTLPGEFQARGAKHSPNMYDVT